MSVSPETTSLDTIALPAKKRKRGDKLYICMDAEQFQKLGMEEEAAVKEAETFENAMLTVLEMRQTIAELQKTVDLVEANARHRAKEIYLKHYEEHQERPASMEVVTATGKASYLFVVSDKYAPLDPPTAVALRNAYPQLVTEEKSLSFDSKVINKHFALIKDAIARIRKIPKEDKDTLVKEQIKYSITKGTVDKLNSYDATIPHVFNLIRPDFCIKDLQPVTNI